MKGRFVFVCLLDNLNTLCLRGLDVFVYQPVCLFCCLSHIMNVLHDELVTSGHVMVFQLKVTILKCIGTIHYSVPLVTASNS